MIDPNRTASRWVCDLPGLTCRTIDPQFFQSLVQMMQHSWKTVSKVQTHWVIALVIFTGWFEMIWTMTETCTPNENYKLFNVVYLQWLWLQTNKQTALQPRTPPHCGSDLETARVSQGVEAARSPCFLAGDTVGGDVCHRFIIIILFDIWYIVIWCMICCFDYDMWIQGCIFCLFGIIIMLSCLMYFDVL